MMTNLAEFILWHEGMQVLAVIELIVFIVASIGLCWICAGKSVDNTGTF